jgi:uncharacterized membrane protein
MYARGNGPGVRRIQPNMGNVHIGSAALLAFLTIGVAGCSRDDEYRDSAAREAGKFAYRIAQETRQAAKKADRNLRQASREARKGWNEAKREAQGRDKK